MNHPILFCCLPYLTRSSRVQCIIFCTYSGKQCGWEFAMSSWNGISVFQTVPWSVGQRLCWGSAGQRGLLWGNLLVIRSIPTWFIYTVQHWASKTKEPPKKCSFCARWNMIFFSCRINSVPFVGMGVVVGEGLWTVVQFSLPHRPLSPWLPACVCVCDLPFEPTMSDAFGPMTHAVCFWERDTGPKLNQPFVCPHKTSLPAWQNTGLTGLDWSYKPIEKLRVREGWKQVPVVEVWGGSFSCIADFWQTINRIAWTAKRHRDCLKGNNSPFFASQKQQTIPSQEKKNKKLKEVNRKLGMWRCDVQMRVHHNHHMTWISALTHFAVGCTHCTAGQGHTVTEELLQQDMMVHWGLLYHAVHHEFQWTSTPGQPRELHPG